MDYREISLRVDELLKRLEGDVLLGSLGGVVRFRTLKPVEGISWSFYLANSEIMICLRGGARVVTNSRFDGENFRVGSVLLFERRSFLNLNVDRECEVLCIRDCGQQLDLRIMRWRVCSDLGLGGELMLESSQSILVSKQGVLALMWIGLFHGVEAVHGKIRALDQLRVLLWEAFDRLKLILSSNSAETESIETRVMDYIGEQFTRPINREIAAEELGLSAGYLGRIVKIHTGKSFQEYLLESRLERSRLLLANTRLNVEEIAFSCGFAGGNYFAQAFRKEEGIGPLAWRKRSTEVD